MARAVAAAVLGHGDKVKYVLLASKQKIVAVSSGQVDLTSRTTTELNLADFARANDLKVE